MAAAERIIARLLDLADKERRLLLTGRLEDLAALEGTKKTFVQRLEAIEGPVDTAALGRLRRAAEENQQLYRAALIGVRRVRDQVAALIKAGTGDFRTYGPDGGRAPLASAGPKLERKA